MNAVQRLLITMTMVALTAGLTLITPQPAAAADGIGMNCGGTNAFRCAWLDWTPTGFLNAGGVISDQTSPFGPVSIRVSFQLRQTGTSTWTTLTGDWVHSLGTLEDETSPRIPNCNWDYRSRVDWVAAGGSDSVYSGTFRRPGC